MVVDDGNARVAACVDHFHGTCDELVDIDRGVICRRPNCIHTIAAIKRFEAAVGGCQEDIVAVLAIQFVPTLSAVDCISRLGTVDRIRTTARDNTIDAGEGGLAEIKASSGCERNGNAGVAGRINTFDRIGGIERSKANGNIVGCRQNGIDAVAAFDYVRAIPNGDKEGIVTCATIQFVITCTANNGFRLRCSRHRVVTDLHIDIGNACHGNA